MINRTDSEQVNQSENAEYSSVLRVNLSRNRMISFRLSEKTDSALKERMKTNNDYRQGMLAYVLERLVDSDKERVIQTLMPEHLAAQLNFRDKVVCEFHEMRAGSLLLFRLEIFKDPEHPTDVLIGINAKAEENRKKKEYIVGSRRIFLMGSAQTAARVLEDGYELRSVTSAAELKEILELQWDTAAALIIGTDCPELEAIMSGIQSNEAFRLLPIVIAADSLHEVPEDQLLKQGAAEFIRLPCPPAVLKNRIAAVIRCRELAETVKHLEKDPRTGVYTRDSFYRYAARILQDEPAGDFEAVMIRIANIRTIQGKYGDVVTGMAIDFILSHIRQEIPGIAVCGRFSDGDFAILRRRELPCDYVRILSDIRSQAPVQNPALKAGAVHAGKGESIKQLCGKAQRVVASISETYGVHYAEYDAQMQQNDRRTQNILDNMETALEQRQFEVYFQPKHCAVSGKVCGAEALVRWIHPVYGFMNPGEFIPLFERVGFIRGLDRYIFANICQTIAAWKAMGLPVIPISVNLSRRDFETGDLADWILNLTGRMHIEPEWLHIEVTETAYTDNPEQINICLQRLHEAGFSIELDDFGVGYSSLTMLNDIHVDILKIDKSIIEKDVPGHGRSILEFCMQLAKIMNLKTVAEGVETEAQRQRVCALGCSYIQGFYYAGPMPRKNFEEYLRTHKSGFLT